MSEIAPIICLAAVAVIAIVVLVVNGGGKKQVINCAPVQNSGDLESDAEESFEGYEGMGHESAMSDPYHDSHKLMPQAASDNAPAWVKSFTDGNDKLLQQNFIDSTNTEKFQVTRSVCGRRFMSRDVRRTPTVTRDPTTVNSMQLPVIDPVCAKEFNEIRPALDCF